MVSLQVHWLYTVTWKANCELESYLERSGIFKVVSLYLSGGAEENYENLSG
jgi:hypothetical protein